MSKFLLKIFLFILPIVLCMYPIDYLISNNLSKSNEFAGGEIINWNDIYSGEINSDIVIYGSSRAWILINPQILEDSLQMSTYNLGIDGHNFWLQYFRHKELLKYNKKPKHIIISLDIFTLQKRSDLYNYRQFLPYLLWNDDLKEYTSSYDGFSFFDYSVPLVRYFGEEDAFITSLKCLMDSNYSEPVRVKGYKGIEREWSKDFLKAKAKADSYEILFDSLSIKLFDQFIKECKNDNIKLTLVYAPEYIEGQNFVTNRHEILSMYQDFAFKNNLQFLDYSDDEISMQKQYFYNAEHLNKKGSELFTQKLVKDLQTK